MSSGEKFIYTYIYFLSVTRWSKLIRGVDSIIDFDVSRVRLVDSSYGS